MLSLLQQLLILNKGVGNSLPENVDYINSCANFTKNNIEQTIAQFYTKYIPNENRNFTNILSLKLTSAEKNSLNWAQQDTNVAQIAQKANATRKDLLYAKLTDNVDDYYDCIYPDNEEIPNRLTEAFASQKLKSKEKMMQELKTELNNSIIRGESAQDVINNTNGIFEKHSESLPNIVQNFEEKVSTYLAVQQGEEQGFKYYLHICNTPETACGICAHLHNTVHSTSDLESMQPHHQNCKCTLVLLDEAYIQSLENTNKKSDDNFWTKLLDGFQTALDLAGFIPGFGEIADGTNAAIYFARGDYFNASLSAAAMVPVVGWLSTGSKLGRKALKAADKIDDVARIVNKADDVSGAVKGAGKDIASRLTRAQSRNTNTLKNIVENNLTDGDFGGALADLQGKPIPKLGGGYWDHLTEMKQSYTGLNGVKSGLEGSLQNPNLTLEVRTFLQDQLKMTNTYIQKIQDLFKPFGGI